MGPGFSPLAEALDLGPEQCSPWLLERAVRLGAELPFATAAEVLALRTGSHRSPSTIRRATIASGTALRQRELAFSAEVDAGTAAASPVPTTRLQLSLDGSMIPLVHGEWREVRLLAIGELPPDAAKADAPAFAAPSYAAGLGAAETFAQEALGEVVRRGLDQAPRVAAVSDGASWIQGFVDLHCPQAVRILDFAHAAGYLAQAATEAFGAATEATQNWFAAQRHELRHGDPDQALAALAALPAGAAQETALRYLGERRAMIAYHQFAAAGWPLGSGCVESAHKHVVQARLKRSGMHWTPAVVPAMLALRVTLANRRWDETWPRLTAQRRATRRDQRAAQRRLRRTASLASPPPAVAPRRGKPAPDHPWRRPFLRPFPAPATKT